VEGILSMRDLLLALLREATPVAGEPAENG
jgi:hypothetical protein